MSTNPFELTQTAARRLELRTRRMDIAVILDSAGGDGAQAFGPGHAEFSAQRP
jgi:hypothetical protein